MKKLLIIVGLIFFFTFYVRHSKFRQAWDHFWGVNTEYPQGQGQLEYRRTNNETTRVKNYTNPVDVYEDNQIKYRLQKNPSGDTADQNQFDFTLRDY